MPIRWIGRRHIDCSRHADPRTVWPVHIATNAIGDNMPHRDLFLSPDHAVLVDDVLIPARQLINGDNVLQMVVDDVIHFHIELDCRDVVFSEGLATETYLDAGNRPHSRTLADR